MRYLYLIPLAKMNIGGQNGWIFEMFKTARASAIGHSSAIASLALSIACIFVVFKMVKISADLMSDEQHAGFAGIKLWDLLRPMAIIILLNGMPWFLNALDTVCNTVSISITNSLGNKDMKAMFTASAVAICDAAEAEQGKEFADNLSAMNEQEQIYKQEVEDIAKFTAPQSIFQDTRQLSGMAFGMRRAAKTSKNRAQNENVSNMVDIAIENANKDSGLSAEQIEALKQDPDTRSLFERAVQNFANETLNMQNIPDDCISFKRGTFLPALAMVLYDLMFKVMQCFAELILCILIIVSPFIVAFSILEPFKKGIVDFIAKYIQVSFWKVIAAAINFAVVSVTCGGMSYSAKQALASLSQQSDNVASAAHLGGGMTLTAIICIAGFIAMLQIPSIASAVIPSSVNTGDMGAGGVAKGALSLPGKAASAAKGLKK